jgi:hypothetical protein
MLSPRAPSGERLLSDDEALLLARGLVDKYGDMARGFAHDCAEVYVKYGDQVGMTMWRKIGSLVDLLLTSAPPGLTH